MCFFDLFFFFLLDFFLLSDAVDELEADELLLANADSAGADVLATGVAFGFAFAFTNTLTANRLASEIVAINFFMNLSPFSEFSESATSQAPAASRFCQGEGQRLYHRAAQEDLIAAAESQGLSTI